MNFFLIRTLILLVTVFTFQSCKKEQGSYNDITGLYLCKVIHRAPYITQNSIDQIVILYDEVELDTTIHVDIKPWGYYSIPEVNSEILFTHEENKLLPHKMIDSNGYISISANFVNDSLKISKHISSDYLEYDGEQFEPILYVSERYFCYKP